MTPRSSLAAASPRRCDFNYSTRRPGASAAAKVSKAAATRHQSPWTRAVQRGTLQRAPPRAIDTNILVTVSMRVFLKNNASPSTLLRRESRQANWRVPHQAVIEFVVAVTRPVGKEGPLPTAADAYLEAEDLFNQFDILYPNEQLAPPCAKGCRGVSLAVV